MVATRASFIYSAILLASAVNAAPVAQTDNGVVGTVLGEDGCLGDTGPLFSADGTLGKDGPVFGDSNTLGKDGPIFGNDNSGE